MKPVFLSLLLLSSCIDGRSYLTTRHRHLHYEVEVQRNIRREIRVTHEINQNRLTLQFQEILFCRHVQFDVEKMSLVRTQTRPGAAYYMMLGGLIAALSIPSYYMGVANSSGTARAIHLSVGTGIFLAPGLSIGGYGLWKRLEESTTVEDAGNVRREVKSTDFTCGKAAPAAGSRVEVLTRIGHVPLGELPADGRITADLERLQPLRNEESGRIYLDVFVNSERVGTIVLSDPKTPPPAP
jgi:hypothetical protein